jgi:hypothetical protein
VLTQVPISPLAFIPPVPLVGVPLPSALPLPSTLPPPSTLPRLLGGRIPLLPGL